MKKVTSIKIDPSIWREVKKLAIDTDINITDFVEIALKKELEKKRN